MRSLSSGQHQNSLEERLRTRREDIEQAILARIAAISDPATAPDSAYIVGLQAALTAAVDYGLNAVAEPEQEPPPVPVELLTQARLAVRNRVSLDAVLRRYTAGYSLLSDSLLTEAAAVGLSTTDLQSTLRALARCYDCVVAAASNEYEREATATFRDNRDRVYSTVCSLLAGDSINLSNLDHDFDAHQLAFIALGPGLHQALVALGARINGQLLHVQPDEDSAWAWLATRPPFERNDLDFLTDFDWPEGSVIACGEASRGLIGWRASHRQAVAALPIAQRRITRFANYSDVALLTTVLRDELLANRLRSVYLRPLASRRDQGTILKDTLRAYFAASGNVSSSAARLGVNRRTVSARLSTIERLLGRPVANASAELELALQLDELDPPIVGA